MNQNFTSIEGLESHIQDKKVGNILVGYRNVSDYAGMVLGIGIIFDTHKTNYELDLEWISFGLDLYGENLIENYLYKFEDLQTLVDYVHKNYGISVTDIPKQYNIDQSKFPNPLKDADQKPRYEKAWQKFQDDFKNDEFLDNSLHLVFSTNA